LEEEGLSADTAQKNALNSQKSNMSDRLFVRLLLQEGAV
jgi:hypothetical protein